MKTYNEILTEFEKRLREAFVRSIDDLRPVAVEKGFTNPDAFIAGWLQGRVQEISRKIIQEEL